MSIKSGNNWYGLRERRIAQVMSERAKHLVKYVKGQTIERELDNAKYRLNASYVVMKSVAKYSDLVYEELDWFGELCRRFEEVVAIRVPVKEQVFCQMQEFEGDHYRFEKLTSQYEQLWQLFKREVRPHRALDLREGFKLEHYHPLDTHWSDKGNAQFHRLVCEVM